MRGRLLPLVILLSVLTLLGCSETGLTSSPDDMNSPASAEEEPLDSGWLLDQLGNRGMKVTPLSRRTGMIDWFGGREVWLCTDGQQVLVMEYPSVEARVADSDQIPANASSIGAGNIDINGWFRFYTRAELLVLYLGLEEGVAQELAMVLGPTITPTARPRGAFGGEVDAERAAEDFACDGE